MIHIDQVRTLELKVKQAVQLIVHLRRENDHLRGRLADTEVRLQELEDMLQSLKASQNEIESGIRSALLELDHLEEGEAVSPEPAAVQETPVEMEVPEAAVIVDTPRETFEEIFETPSDEEFLTPPDEAEPSVSPSAAPEEEEEQPGLGIF